MPATPRMSISATVAMRFMVPPMFLEEIIFESLFSSRWYRRNRTAKAATFLLYFLELTRRKGPSIDKSSREITDLLRAWNGGDEAALGRLAERVYPELRNMARRYVKNERHGN